MSKTLIVHPKMTIVWTTKDINISKYNKIISSFMFHGKKKVTQVWNDRVNDDKLYTKNILY